jgi:hypothetical protein
LAMTSLDFSRFFCSFSIIYASPPSENEMKE